MKKYLTLAIYADGEYITGEIFTDKNRATEKAMHMEEMGFSVEVESFETLEDARCWIEEPEEFFQWAAK